MCVRVSEVCVCERGSDCGWSVSVEVQFSEGCSGGCLHGVCFLVGLKGVQWSPASLSAGDQEGFPPQETGQDPGHVLGNGARGDLPPTLSRAWSERLLLGVFLWGLCVLPAGEAAAHSSGSCLPVSQTSSPKSTPARSVPNRLACVNVLTSILSAERQACFPNPPSDAFAHKPFLSAWNRTRTLPGHARGHLVRLPVTHHMPLLVVVVVCEREREG